MGNLYEHTLTLKYIRDMVFLEVIDETQMSETWDKEMNKLSKNVGPIDDAKEAVFANLPNAYWKL